ncbi:Ig-like domain-containing protein [Vibrio sp. CDRSL-10 TSBA]
MGLNSLVTSGILSANQMIVIDPAGNVRIATVGEQLPQGTVIVQIGNEVNDDAAVRAQLVDANNMPQDITDDVEQIFAALEDGQDPTQIDGDLAPAAGGVQGSAVTDSATIERTDSETIATTDFETSGLESLGLSETQSLALTNLVTADATEITLAVAGTVTVDPITDDGVINFDESESTITVSGTATGGDISEGDTVSMIINGTPYSTTVDADGNWSVDVAGSDLANDTEFDVTVTSTSTDGTSVESSATSTHTVDLSADSGVVTINPITSDNIINEQESGQTIEVGGTATGGDISEGDIVTVTINGTDYSTTVDGDGNWSIGLVPGEDLANDTDFVVTVTSSDEAGNTVDSSTTANHTVDLSFGDDDSFTPIVQIVDDLNDDGVINESELGNDGVQVSVTVDPAELARGGSVTLTINNGGTETEVTLSLNEDGSTLSNSAYSYDASTGEITWSIDVAEDDTIAVSALQTDVEGNESNTGSDSALVDTLYGEDDDNDGAIVQPTVSITDNSGDVDGNDAELISGTEQATIRGTIGETDAARVDLVISDGTTEIVIADVTVNADGTFSVEDVDVSSLSDGELTVTATFTDADDNVVTADDTVQKDTAYGEDDDNDGSIVQPTVSITDNSGDVDGNDAELISGSEQATIRGTIGDTDAARVDLVISDGTNQIVLEKRDGQRRRYLFGGRRRREQLVRWRADRHGDVYG